MHFFEVSEHSTQLSSHFSHLESERKNPESHLEQGMSQEAQCSIQNPLHLSPTSSSLSLQLVHEDSDDLQVLHVGLQGKHWVLDKKNPSLQSLHWPVEVHVLQVLSHLIEQSSPPEPVLQ